ncbi:MAG: hypothetical protein MUO62_13415 [Anaerolineales bacterium]|nr:hypothetical protein [Anaerolineales bacterium]
MAQTYLPDSLVVKGAAMGFFKSIFGGKEDDAREPEHDPVLDYVDPETGFEHAWSDDERYEFCKKAVEKLKGQLGGDLRMTDEEMRLYTEWNGRAVVVGGDWFTGDLVVSIVGENRLGPIGMLRDDALDEDGEMNKEEHTAGWSDDTILAGDVREYVAEGIYIETPQQAVEYERKRISTLPDALRTRILDEMQNGRLQSIFTSEDSLDLTWERSFFRKRDLAKAVGGYLELSTAVFDVLENNPDPDPRSPNSEQRCPYCDQKIVDLNRTKCDSCGGLL